MMVQIYSWEKKICLLTVHSQIMVVCGCLQLSLLVLGLVHVYIVKIIFYYKH